MACPPRILVLASILLVASPALAQDQPAVKTAADHARDAERAFEDGRFADADKAIDRGLGLEANNHPLLLLRGEIRLAVRDFEGALTAYEAYLAAKPRGANRRKARKIIANLAASRRTILEITVNSGPANIYLDSKSIGVYCVANPSCKKGMLPGRYRVFIERDGFDSKTEEVTLRLGKSETLTVELVEKPSTLTVALVPSDAAISLDGKVLEKSADAPTVVEVAPGEHVIEASLDGFVAVKKTVTASQGKPANVVIALAELVAVTVNITSATLTLDGNPVTLDNGKLTVPSDGKLHSLVATAEGYSEASVTIAADRERGTPIAITLQEVSTAVGPPRVAQSGWSQQRKGAFIALVAVSGVGVVAGSFTGLSANSKWGDAESRCDGDFCDAQGLKLIDDARTRATQSNIAFGVALATAFGAAVVYLTTPKANAAEGTPSGPALTPTVSATSASLSLRGAF